MFINNPDKNEMITGMIAYSIIQVEIPKMTWFSVSESKPKNAPRHGPKAKPKIIKIAYVKLSLKVLGIKYLSAIELIM